MKNVIDALNWRYATQVFDSQKKLTPAQLDLVLDAARLSPSSYGLQLWKFVVVENVELRAKLKEAGYGQSKITDASHYIVITIPSNITTKNVDDYIAVVASTRGVPTEQLVGYRDMMYGTINARTPEERVAWATKQAYIALGVLLTAAATEGIDAGPMEGFDTKKFDEILGLAKLGLESKVAVGVGFRSESDAMAKAKKVRFAKEDVVITMR